MTKESSDMKTPKVNVANPLDGAAVGISRIEWMGGWRIAPHAERRRLGKLGDLRIALRSIHGGDGRYRPIIEITGPQAVRRMGPRGGMSVKTNNIASNLGKPESSHRDAITQGVSWLSEWISDRP